MATQAILQDDQQIIKEGYLEKQSRYIKEWRKRWFVLTPQHLRSFVNTEEYNNPTETICLNECSIATCADEETGKDNSFKVKSRTRVFYLICDTSADKDSWIDAINNQMLPELSEDDGRDPEKSGNQQDDFENHVERLLQHIQDVNSKCSSTTDPDVVLYHAIRSMNDMQGSTRYLLKKLDDMYTQGMPEERKQQCKAISTAFWNLQTETLTLTPCLRRTAGKKLTAAKLLKFMHTELQKVDLRDDAQVPQIIHDMKARTLDKLMDVEKAFQSDHLLKKVGRLAEFQSQIVADIFSELSVLKDLQAKAQNDKQNRNWWKRVFIGLTAVALLCALVAVPLALQASAASASANAASAQAAAAVANLQSATSAVAKAQNALCWFFGVTQRAVDAQIAAAAAATAAADVASAAQASASVLTAGTLTAGGVASACAAGSCVAGARAHALGAIVDVLSATRNRMGALEERYQKLHNNLDCAGKALQLVKNLLDTADADADFFTEHLEFWHLMKCERLGYHIDKFTQSMEEILKQTDELESITREGIGEALRAPGRRSIQISPVHTSIKVSSPEPFFQQGNAQEPSSSISWAVIDDVAGASDISRAPSSIHSWTCSIVQGMHCFLGEAEDGSATNFLTEAGTLVNVESLREDDFIQGPTGGVQIVGKRVHAKGQHSVFDLKTDEFILTATGDHRVMVQGNDGFEPQELESLSSGVIRASNGADLSFTVTRRSAMAALYELTFREDQAVYMRMSSPSMLFGEVRGATSVPYDPATYTMFRIKGPICNELLKVIGIKQWCTMVCFDNDCSIESLQIKFWESRPYAVWVHDDTADQFFEYVDRKLRSGGDGGRRSKAQRVKCWQFDRRPSSPEPLTP